MNALTDVLISASGDVTLQSDSDSSGTGDVVLKTGLFTVLTSGLTGVVARLTQTMINSVGARSKQYPADTPFFQIDSARGNVMVGPNQAFLPDQNKARWLVDAGYIGSNNRWFARDLITREVDNPSQWLAGSFGPSYTSPSSTTTTASVSANPITTVNGSQAATSSTITVADTSAFPTSGTVEVLDSTSLTNTIAYTGKTATTLTGCTGASAARTLSNGAVVTGLVTLPVASTSGYYTPVTVTDGAGVVHCYDGYLQIGAYPNEQFVRYTSKDATNFLGCSGLTATVASGSTVNVAAPNPDLDGMGGGLGVTGLANGSNVCHWWGMPAINPWLDDTTLAVPNKIRRDYPAKQNRADTSIQAIAATINIALTENPYSYHFRSPMVNSFASGGNLSIATSPKGMSTPKERLYVNDRGALEVMNGWIAAYLHEVDQPTCAITATGGSLPYSNTGIPDTDFPLNMKVYKVQAYWKGTGTAYHGTASGPATTNGSGGVSSGSTKMPVVVNATSQISVTWRRITGASGYKVWCGHYVSGTGLVWDGYYDVAEPGTNIFTNPTVSQNDDGTRSGGGWTTSTAGPPTDNRNFGDANRPRSTLFHDRIRLGQTDAATTWGVDIVRTATKQIEVVDQLGALAQLTDNKYRIILDFQPCATAANVTGSGVYLTSPQAVEAQTAAGTAPVLIYLDPSDYSAQGRATKLRIVSGCMVTDTAPAVAFTIGLYPVGSVTGGATVINPNFGTVVSGSTVTWTTPVANSMPAPLSSGDFTFPAAGWYGIGFDINGAMSANSSAVLPFRLEVRLV